MTTWDHRAPTGNSAYQLYLFVNEKLVDNSGIGVSWVDWELGFIKVGSSGGFASGSGSFPWSVKMHGNNNGDRDGTGSFSFAAGDAIGTRRAFAWQSDWTFSHNPNGDGKLTLSTFASANVPGTSLAYSQIGWGDVVMGAASRQGAVPPAPTFLSRQSDTQVTIRAYNSTDWGLGTAALQHNLDKADVSNMSVLLGSTAYPTTGGGAAHSVVQSGLTPHKSYYFRDAFSGRTAGWKTSAVLTVHARPNQPAAPSLGSKTATTLNLTLAAPSYVGGGITERETQLYASDGTTLLATSTHLTAPTFGSLSRTTTYKARTRAKNAVDWSDWSSFLTVSTPGTPPSAPTGYTCYDIAATSFKVTTGSLSDNGGVVPSKVRVKVSTTASDVGLVQTIELNSWNAVRVSGKTENTNYWVAEAAFNTAEGGGWGPYGSWVAVPKTLNTVPNAPVLSLDSAGATSATLEWVAPTDLNGAVITSYKLRVASDEALTLNVQEFSTAALSQVVTELTSGTTYYASVWTMTGNGLGSSSPVLSFATTGGGITSGVWLSDAGGTPEFSEVWFSGADGTPKLCEVWFSGADGVPKLCTS